MSIYKKYEPDAFDCIILDEAHQSSAKHIPEGNELFYTKVVAWNDSDS